MKRRLLLLLLGSACAGETYFPESVAESLCGRLATCDASALAADYGAASDCRDVVYASMKWFEAEAIGLSCAYDIQAARACLRTLRADTCAPLDVADALAMCGAAYGCAEDLP